ncbi:unnamed protein product [Clonostachys rosea]|uniref:Uncharacterized protein n=1 Tax=Bionectria ochroleuca TaxID=29856 RepID=A0ABY6UF99_BIOOC|nr:unnamed protein product [Clonostachys rosea]
MAGPQSKAESYTPPFFISGVLRLDVSGDKDAMAPPALTDNTYLQPSLLEQRRSLVATCWVKLRCSSFHMLPGAETAGAKPNRNDMLSAAHRTQVPQHHAMTKAVHPVSCILSGFPPSLTLGVG